MLARPHFLALGRAWRTLLYAVEGPENMQIIDHPIYRRPQVLRKTVFFIGSSAAIFAGAAWYTNHRANQQWRDSLPVCEANPGVRCGRLSRVLPCLVKQKNEQLRRVRTWYDGLCVRWPRFAGSIQGVVQLYKDCITLSDSGRFYVGLTTVHIGIALLWRVPRLRTFLARHTIHSGLSGLNYTMITSGFTHLSLIHLFANSVILYTFSASLDWIGESGGPESFWTNNLPHILAFYTVAGLFGQYLPNVASLTLYRQRIASLPSSATVFNVEKWMPAALCPAAGASASVCAVVILTAFTLGEPSSAMLNVLGHDVSWAQGLSMLIAVELYKLFFTRRSGAAEHLSGALFGCFYYFAGPPFWAFMRDAVGNRHTWVVADYDEDIYRAFVHDSR